MCKIANSFTTNNYTSNIACDSNNNKKQQKKKNNPASSIHRTADPQPHAKGSHLHVLQHLEEREGHAPSNDHLVYLVQQVVDQLDLVFDLSPARYGGPTSMQHTSVALHLENDCETPVTPEL